MPQALVSWKPAADVWSVMENLCHVDEFIPYWTGQAEQAARQPDQPWGRDHTSTARIDAVNRAGARSLADVLGSIEGGARAAGARIRRMTDQELDTEATSRNPKWGLKPAAFVLDHLVAEHVEKHLGQVRRNVAQYEQQK